MGVLLLTGAPGVGKTTIVRAAVRLAAGKRVRGFFTGEIRGPRGDRLGFRIETVDGRSAPLAGVAWRSEHRVGRYGVDVDALEAVAVPSLELEPGAVYLVDEIGKMECLSPGFVRAIGALLDSDLPMVATVAQHGAGFIAQVKRHPRAELVEVTRSNRDALLGRVLEWVDREVSRR